MSVISRVEQTQLYISVDGGATWIPWDGTGGAGGSGDGALLDGANPLIQATVKDYTNANPLAVITVDTNGDPVSAGGGGLTDAELRASAVPVSVATIPSHDVTNAGVFAVQITGSSVITVGGPLTDIQLRAADVKVTLDGEAVTNANLDVALSTRLKPADTLAAVTSITNVVHVDDNAGSLTIDAAALPLPAGASTSALQTQPGVDIGDVTINNAAGAAGVNIQDGGNSITIDATNLDVALSTRLKPADTLAAVTSITNVVHVDDNAGSLTVDGTVTVTPPTLTKGTQGATGFSTQDLKDSGRTSVIYYAVAAASGTTTTETAITLTKASGVAATSTGVSQTPASGKRFRIEQILVSAVGHATGTTQATTFSLRINTAGAVVTTSTPIVWRGRVQTPATSLAYQQISLPIPDGYEILGDGTLQFGMTANAVFVTNAPTWDVTIIGFEY